MLLGITELPCVTASAPEARHWLRKLLGREHPAMADAELLLAELVANSINHTTSTTITITAALPDQRRLRIDVVDNGHPDHQPHLASPDALAENGRGLLLVKALATACGHTTDETGQTVWFEVTF